MLLLILFAFLSGLVIVLSPCVWPILPIIFSAGAGGERRPLGMVMGLAVSLSLFTLLFTSFLHLVPIEPETLRLVATGLIFVFGITLVIPRIGHWFESVLGRFIPLRNSLLEKRQGFKGGLLTGGAIGIVWSPCAGPILATVGSLSATQPLSFGLVLVMLSFALGIALPLYGLALLSQHLLSEMRTLSPYLPRIRQGFGILVILSAWALYSGYDLVLQERFTEFCAQNGLSFLASFQTNPIVTEELEVLREAPPR